jgi:hypothetical protein
MALRPRTTLLLCNQGSIAIPTKSNAMYYPNNTLGEIMAVWISNTNQCNFCPPEIYISIIEYSKHIIAYGMPQIQDHGYLYFNGSSYLSSCKGN